MTLHTYRAPKQNNSILMLMLVLVLSYCAIVCLLAELILLVCADGLPDWLTILVVGGVVVDERVFFISNLLHCSRYQEAI